MKSVYEIIRRPVITEKATALQEKGNQVVFAVDRNANKVEIRHAVEEIFGVSVAEVRTQMVRGKDKRVGRNIGRRPNWKKAIVTLKEGETIDLFAGAGAGA